jgi:predicted O-linked N-acetylglucosamine transferase (SPINDLY family)
MKASQSALQVAVEHHQVGRLAEAEAIYRQILEAQPGNPDALALLGLVAHQRGMSDRAVELIEKAHRIGHPQAFSLNSLGLAYMGLDRADKAKPCFGKAIKLQPDYAEAHNNLGAAFKALGRPADAETCYRRALTLKPDYADTHYNLANLLEDLGRAAEAEQSYRRALAFKPDYAEAYNNLGLLLSGLGRPEEAEECLRRAVAFAPESPNMRCLLGCVLYDLGRLEEARECFRQAFELAPDFAETRWTLAMSRLPWLEERTDDTALKELRALDGWFDPVRVDEGHKAVGLLQPFYLAYQEVNNRELLAEYGRLCARLMRHWLDRQGFAPRAPASREKIRVGIVSEQIRDHSVWNAIVKGWCRHLDRARFDLELFSLGSHHDEETRAAKSMVSKFAQGGRNLRQCVAMILERAPDVLIYPEIGMDAMTLRLASLRLAPVQAAAWGHPETTGLPTIDYYLSAQDFEPADAQENYTEQLIALPHLACCYQPSLGDSIDPNLASLGISADSPLLVCPGTPFKYSPRHDWVFPEIARRLGRCRFIFFLQQPQYLSENFRRRLAETFARAQLDLERYVAFVPKQPRPAFYGLMKRADLLLDTIGFSGFNTAMQAVECGLPIVTCEGRFMRGRFASGILKRIGLQELVAATEEDYVRLVVKLAQEPRYEVSIRERIAASRGVLYEDLAPVRALEEFLINAVRSSTPDVHSNATS